MIRKLIQALLEKNTTVIVPVNCNAPEFDEDYLEISSIEKSFAE